MCLSIHLSSQPTSLYFPINFFPIHPLILLLFIHLSRKKASLRLPIHFFPFNHLSLFLSIYLPFYASIKQASKAIIFLSLFFLSIFLPFFHSIQPASDPVIFLLKPSKYHPSPRNAKTQDSEPSGSTRDRGPATTAHDPFIRVIMSALMRQANEYANEAAAAAISKEANKQASQQGGSKPAG